MIALSRLCWALSAVYIERVSISSCAQRNENRELYLSYLDALVVGRLGTREILDGVVEILLVGSRLVSDAFLELPNGGILGHVV